MKWAALIPLIGGQVLGSKEAIGSDPSELLSYTPFQGNDQYCTNYFKDVPYGLLDEGYKPSGGYQIITSTCPCAGLSSFSSAKTGSPQREAKNAWMKQTSEFVLSELKPDVYLGENAPALFTPMGREVADFMIKTARKHGYGVSFYRTSTRYHGIPQKRPRTFYHFWKGGKVPLMQWFDRPMPPAREYLKPMEGVESPVFGDLQKDSTYQYLKRRYGEDWRTGGGSEVFDSFELLAKSQLMRHFVETWDGEKDNSYRTCERRLQKTEGNVYASMPTFAKEGESYPSVIAKYGDKFVHPVEDRYLNYREIAWLMGLPADFELPPIKQWNVVCQNVPVPTARDITYDAVNFIGGSMKMSDYDVLWFDNTNQTIYYGAEKSSKPNSSSAVAAEDVFSF